MSIAQPRLARAVRLVAALVLSAPLLAQTPSPAPATGAWMPVNVSSGAAHLASLSAEERLEQLRDWALLGAYTLSTPANAAHREALVSMLPARVDALSSLYFRRAGETRSLTLPDGRLLVLVPDVSDRTARQLKRRQLQIGRLLDEERQTKGRIPTTVLVFDYRVDTSSDGVAVRLAAEAPGQTFFRETEGYVEQTVSNAADLDRFLALNLDVTHARLQGTQLVLGGRAFSDTFAPLVTREDLAALAQAGLHIEDEIRAQLQRRGLRAEYDRLVRKRAAEILAEQDSAGAVAPYEDMLRVIREIETNSPYAAFEARQIEAIMADNPPASGFSLDPRLNRAGIAEDLDAALRGDSRLFNGWLLDELKRDVIQARHLRNSRGLEALLALIDSNGGSSRRPAAEKSLRTLIGLESPPTPGEERSLRDLLERGDPSELAVDIAASTRAVITSRADELRGVVSALRQGSDEALFDLQRYLNAETLGLTMRPGASGYRVRDLQQMLRESVDETLTVDGQYGPQTTSALKQFQERAQLKTTGLVNDETWKALLAVNEDTADDIASLRDFLNTVETRNNYQCARYDGRLSGTRAGMTLFYTDLLMKLWSFASKDQSPAVAGFVSETQFATSPVYWEEQRRYSSTRGWLGPRLEGIKFRDATTVNLAPVATRLYNASSNPLISGKEVPATFGPERFSAWWNAHYLDVADYEPQYHRLNQLMKWTVILTAYDDLALPAFSTLSTMPVTRTLHFDSWWDANRQSLRVAPVRAFRQVPGEPTECIDILRSDVFEALGGLYSMSGGVTLPERSAIKTKALANEARGDIPDALRSTHFDVAGASVDAKRIRLSVTEGGTPRGTFELPRNSQAADFRPSAPVLAGNKGTLASDSLRLRYGSSGNGVQISGDAGNEPLFRLTMGKTNDAVTVNYTDGEFFGAIRQFERASRNGDGLEAGRSLWLPDAEQVLVRVSDDRWAAVTRATSRDARNGTSIRFAVGDEPLEARPLTEREFTDLTSGYAWERLSTASTTRSAPLRAAMVKAAPPDAEEITLHIGDAAIPARFDGDSLFVPRSNRAGNAARQLSETLDSTDVDMLLSSVHDDASAAAAAVRGRQSQLVIAATDRPLAANEVSLIDQVLTGEMRGRTVVLLGDNTSGVAVGPSGSIRLARNAAANDVAIAQRAARLLREDDTLAGPLSHLGTLTSSDLDAIARIPSARRAAFVEFRSAPDLRPGEVLADLRVSVDSPDVMLRRSGGVEFVRPSSVTSQKVADQLRYVDDVMNPARAEREGRAALDPTMKEFLDNTRDVYRYLHEIASGSGGKRIITVESGDVNLDTIWALHGGNPQVRFLRDQPDVHASLENTRERVPLDAGRSAVLITAEEDSASDLGHVRSLTDRIRGLAPIGPAVSFETFETVLDEPEVTQLVLVARVQDEGVVFADRWVSFREIASTLEDMPQRPLLIIVSNGGQSVQQTFSDSGRFSRVLLLPYVLGDLRTFEAALENLVHLLEAAGLPRASMTRAEFKSAVEEAGVLAGALAAESRADGQTVTVDVSRVLRRAVEAAADVEAIVTLQALLSSTIQPTRRLPLDEVIDRRNASRRSANDVRMVRKARAEISAMVQVKYE